MIPLTRREFVRGGLTGAAMLGPLAGSLRPTASNGAERDGLTVLGQVAPRDSRTIEASPLSIGFETLDRRMFEPERTYPQLAKLGVKWARTHTGWCRTERTRGEYDFAWLDAVVDSLLRIGIQPWFCVGFGNRLYSPAAPDEFAVGWVPTTSPEGKDAWLRYVGQIAEHFRGRVRHFEIWNEPNAPSFWKPDPPTPEAYVELVKLTAPVIRQRIQDAVIVGGAVMGMNTAFFQGCMERGLGQYIDKASFHSYRFLPEKNYEDDIARWRQIIAKHRPGIELWHGEVGAASQPGGAGGRADYPWTEIRQAKWMLRRFLYDLRMRTELISYFHAVDLVGYRHSEAPTGKTNYKGLLRGTDYTPKPAYFAYQCLCALFDADTVQTELPLTFHRVKGAEAIDVDEIVSAGFSRNRKAMCVYWWPPGPEMERPNRQITLSLAPLPDAQLAAPVLIDPLSATVYQVDRAERHGDRWTITGAPLADHPLIVADRSLVL